MTATEHVGEHGTAVLLTVPQDDPRTAATLDYWLLTVPGRHLWSQYVVACVRLDDVPGYLPRARHWIGATHELVVAALSPLYGRFTAGIASTLMAAGGLPILSPANVVEQFEATDDEMRRVCELAVQAVCAGTLNPEPEDAPAAIREAWLAFIVRALAHLRGEEHAP